jgi:colanic acid biosynthesis glycosyl transferase WcaI
MKILILHFDYDSVTRARARVLRTIAEQQAATGHDTTAFAVRTVPSEAHQTPLPSRETIRGVHVRRVCLLNHARDWHVVRAANTAWFLLRALIHAVTTNHYDLIIAENRPAVLMGFVLRSARALGGVPYIYHCQDLFPESAVVKHQLRRGRLFARLLRWDTAACIAAQRVVVPSLEMAETLTARGVPQPRISVNSNPPLITATTARPTLPPPLDECTDTVRFLFAGELAPHHGLERLIAAARLVAARVPFQFIFMGDGTAKVELIELAGDLLGRRIKFLPPQSIETTVEALRVCDYAIVSLAGDAHRYIHPTESILYGNAGCPLIALVEPHGELAKQIEQHDWGYVAASRSVTCIADTIVKAVIERGRWTPQRRRQIEISRALCGNSEARSAWDRAVSGDADSIAMPRRGRASEAA